MSDSLGHIRSIREGLEKAARRAEDDGDPAAAYMVAHLLALDGLAALVASQEAASVKSIEQARAEAQMASAKAVQAARDGIAAVAVDAVRKASHRIWTATLAGSVALVLVMTGAAALGGYMAGESAGVRAVQAANAELAAVAKREGATAVRDWTRLMRLNRVEAVLSQCSGANAWVEHDQQACRASFWVGRKKGRGPK